MRHELLSEYFVPEQAYVKTSLLVASLTKIKNKKIKKSYPPPTQILNEICSAHAQENA